MAGTVMCVLRAGGWCYPEHVRVLRDQIKRHHPAVRFRVLTDQEIPGVRCLPLLHDWPGWWAKMEMFRPDLMGDFLYLDLDTMIHRDFIELVNYDRLGVMRDVYRPDGLQSAVMWIPESCRGEVWNKWVSGGPKHWMQRFQAGGDQAFLETLWLKTATRLQDAFPGWIVSYKADVMKRRHTPDEARLVVFHGKPKPHEIGYRLP